MQDNLVLRMGRVGDEEEGDTESAANSGSGYLLDPPPGVEILDEAA